MHYHGTPITPRVKLYEMAGRHFCVSFADSRDADICMQIGQSVLWDNGAFSAFTRGVKIDESALYSWLEPRLAHPHWAIIPDRIDGPEEQQREMVRSWPFSREFGAPVWHLSLSLDYLLDLADNWPRVCFGSSGEYWNVGSDAWRRRVDEAFTALAARHNPLPWVHMLRGLSQAGKRWPFASADSANVARNHNGRRDVAKMASRIDRVQTPATWSLPPRQLLLGVDP